MERNGPKGILRPITIRIIKKKDNNPKIYIRCINKLNYYEVMHGLKIDARQGM